MQTRLVAESEAGQRLDRFLVSCLPHVSRSRLQRLIERAQVRVDGKPARSSSIVSAGSRVLFPAEILAEQPTTPEAEELEIRVVYEDADVIVVDKPAAMVVHPAPGNWSGTLVNALLARYPSLAAGGSERPGIAHRLDKDTSGLVVVARTDQALADFSGQLKRREVFKSYAALVHGCPSPETGVISAPIARDPRQRQRMAAAFNGRPAVTEYRLVRRFREVALLDAHPVTGRTHQIRVHLAAVGHPIVGDRVYGRTHDRGPGRQFLHAQRIVFRSPSTGKVLDLQSPLPPDLEEYLATLA